MGFSWEFQIAIILLPANRYAFMLVGCEFLSLDVEIDTTSKMLKHC